MALLPMYEIFILLEDEKEVPLYRLNRWGRKARGVLSKLKNNGWAEKVKKENEIFYRITQKGEQEFDKILNPLREAGQWDGRWRLVIFDIPESKRHIRDQLRRSLDKLGMGILKSSVWISPHNIKKEIEEIGQRLHLKDTLRYFEVTRNPHLDKTIMEKSWDLPDIANLYQKFNFDANRLFRTIDKVQNQRYLAKKLIFEYAKILKKDPQLPREFREKDLLRKKAHDYYLNLRRFVAE